MAVGFTQLLYVASLQTLLTNTVVYAMPCRGLGEVHVFQYLVW